MTTLKTMKGAVLRHIHVLLCREGPVVSQHAAAQGYASRVFPACLRHLSRVSSHIRYTEPPASESSVVKSVRVPDLSSILQLGADNGLMSLSSGFLALRCLLKKQSDFFAVVGSLQGHWWGFISRNYIVWPISFVMNVFIALKGTHVLFLFVILVIWGFHNKSLVMSMPRYLQKIPPWRSEHVRYRKLVGVILSLLHELPGISLG